MKFQDMWHLTWIYNRMIAVYKEDPNSDYMIKFKSLLDCLLDYHFPQLCFGIILDSKLLEFHYNGRQP